MSAVVKVTNIFKGIGSAKLPRKVQKSEMLKKASQSTVDCATSSQRQRQLAERENFLDTSDSSQIAFDFNERQTVTEADSDDIFD